MAGSEEDGSGVNMNLPPGFRFCPTDEELILNFLRYKALQIPNSNNIDIIPDHPHLSTLDPWQLHGEAYCSGNHGNQQYWYFFSKKNESWMTQSGFWKELDYEEPIFGSNNNNKKKIGLKNFLVFYVSDGQVPGDVETNWIMQQYHLSDYGLVAPATRKKRLSNPAKWVLCRVHKNKGGGGGESPSSYSDDDRDSNGTQLSYMDELFLSLEDHDIIL
ncbi:hypothetical protein ACFE04_013793 [Oxalis oulophora]